MPEQQARTQSKPDPILYVTVGKQQRRTAAQLRTDAPVWEQGFTFLVPNPENDTVQLRIVDQKTEREIGHYTYLLSALLDKPGMEVVNQPYQLQHSGAESKIEMSLRLRILKNAAGSEDNVPRKTSIGSVSTTSTTTADPSTGGLLRNASLRKAELMKQDSKLSVHSYGGTAAEDAIAAEPLLRATVAGASLAAEPPSAGVSHADGGSGSTVSQLLHHRTPSSTSSAGHAGLGRILLTLRYSVHRQRLTVLVHRIM